MNTPIRLFFILSIFAFWSNLNVFAASSVVTGKVDGVDTELAFTFSTDYVSENSITFPVSISSKGTFSITLDIDEPISGTLSMGTWTMPVFIHPRDTLSLSFTQVDDSYTVLVGGRYQNDINLLREIYANRIPEEDLVLAMANNGVKEFKTWLRERYDLYRTMRQSFKDSLEVSKEFDVYIHSEIEYRYAHSLLRYRIEHPVANDMVPPLQLPKSYLDDLSDVVVNNPDAVTSQAYRLFLNEYVKWYKEIAKEEKSIVEEENYVITTPVSMLFSEPDIPSNHDDVLYGSVVEFLGLISEEVTNSRIGGETTEDHWYKVKLSNGAEGWLMGQTMARMDPTLSEDTKAVVQKIETKSKVVNKVVVHAERVDVVNNPIDQVVLKTMLSGVQMECGMTETGQTFKYKFEGINYIGKFLKVIIDGVEGWVFEYGVRKESAVEENTVVKEIVTLAALEQYKYLDSFLKGATLYHYIGSDLARRLFVEKDSNIKADLENFLKVSDNEEVNRFLEYHYSEIYATQLDFELNAKDIQLVSLIEVSNEDDIVATTLELNGDVEVFKNHVNLPKVPEKPNKYETKIALSGKINAKILQLSNPLSGPQIVLCNSITSNNTSYSHSNNEFAILEVNTASRPIYLKAGADISISIIDGGQPSFMTDENKALGRLHDTFLEAENNINVRLKTNEKEVFKAYISAVAKQKMTLLKEQTQSLGLDDEFVKDMTYDINYWLGYHLLRYSQDRSSSDEKWSASEDDPNFFDFLNQIDINPLNRALGQNYRNFIRVYFSYISGQIDNKKRSAKSLIEEHFNGYSRDYLMGLELFSDIFKGDYVGTGKEIARFIQMSPHVALSKTLASTYNANLPLRAGALAPGFELKDNNGRIVTLDQFRGKIIVLDFWATWCAPCLNKMEEDKLIIDKYSADDVVFLYVSLDASESKWQTHLSMNADLDGLHTFPSSNVTAFESPIAQAYKVINIPAFFIIDKNGNLAYDPFTTLSATRIRDHIDNLLYK